MNLTKIKGCYSKELRDGCNDIKLLLKEKTITVEQMKSFIEALVEPAFIEHDAKKRFLKNLKSCKTKIEIDELCRLVVLHGMYYTPHKKSI